MIKSVMVGCKMEPNIKDSKEQHVLGKVHLHQMRVITPTKRVTWLERHLLDTYAR